MPPLPPPPRREKREPTLQDSRSVVSLLGPKGSTRVSHPEVRYSFALSLYFTHLTFIPTHDITNLGLCGFAVGTRHLLAPVIGQLARKLASAAAPAVRSSFPLLSSSPRPILQAVRPISITLTYLPTCLPYLPTNQSCLALHVSLFSLTPTARAHTCLSGLSLSLFLIPSTCPFALYLLVLVSTFPTLRYVKVPKFPCLALPYFASPLPQGTLPYAYFLQVPYLKVLLLPSSAPVPSQPPSCGPDHVPRFPPYKS